MHQQIVLNAELTEKAIYMYIYMYLEIFVNGYCYFTARHSKQLPVGLMVLSDEGQH